jgi:hypothetical protein
MHKNQLYLNTSICLFLTRVAGIGKNNSLKLVIQGLLQLYNRHILSNSTKTKALLMVSISKVAFNIDGLTIHSTIEKHVQQSLSNLPNLSSDSLNRLTCRYEQLQLVVIDEISLVGAKMFNVIDNRLRSIKHIQNYFFGGVDVIMINDFYQTPLVKNSWIFQKIKDNVNALTPIFWQTYVQCYELIKL